jgi:membrane protein DedA with SNARE-associated domain
MEWFVAWLLELSPATVYAVIGLTTLVENVFPPTPSDVAVALGGFLAQHDRVSPLWVWLVACCANLGGSGVVYLLARRYGRQFIASRLGSRLLPADAIVALEREYLRFGMAGIFLGRLLPGFRSVVAPFAGLVNLPAGTALLPITLATMLWYGLLTWAGARLGAEWEAISGFLAQVNRTLGILALLAALAIVVFVLRRRKARPPRRDRLLRAVHRALGSEQAEMPTSEGQDPAAAGAAALLFELARADHEITGEERELITVYLRDHWRLEGDGERRPASQPGIPLPAVAHTAEMATLLSGRYGRERRLELVRQLYRIAASDGTLSRHEQRLMLRAAALLGLSAEDVEEARRNAPRE